MYKKKMSQPEGPKPEIIKETIDTTPKITNVLPTEEQVTQIIEMVQDQMAKSAVKQTKSEVNTPPSNTTDKQPNSEVETPLSNTTVTPTDTTPLKPADADTTPLKPADADTTPLKPADADTTAATPTPEELAAAEKAVTDAETALNEALNDDKPDAQKALDAAKAKLAELKAKTGGRRRSTRRRQKKSSKKSRRQSKKGGKKHRKRTSKKGGKSKKRSQRKH